MSKNNIYHSKFIKQAGKLVATSKSSYDIFMKSVDEGQVVDIFMESGEDDGTIPQLAKIHACIRQLAKDTGHSFEDMKFEIKRHSGLCIKRNINGVLYLDCKSFADCSKDELGLAIQSIIEIGETVGINFH